MESLFVGLMYFDSDLEFIKNNSNSGFGVAANNFQLNFIKGLQINLENNITVFSFLPIGAYPNHFKKHYIKTKKYSISNSFRIIQKGFLNVFIIKEISRTVLFFLFLLKWSKKNSNGGVIIVYSLYVPFLFALKLFYLFNSKSQFHSNLIVPDLPGKFGINNSNNFFQNLIYKVDSYLKLSFSKTVSSYTLLTKHMADVLKIGENKFVLLEGLIELTNYVACKQDGNKRIILYYGSLNKEYGISNLIKSFKKIIDDDFYSYELWICGLDSHNVISSANIKNDNRIKYFGFLMKNKLDELQKKAHFLINPRPNFGTYVKYSFPSKTMEYLVSGKPVMMYKLDGIPEDYNDFYFELKSTDPCLLANEIVKICHKSNVELSEFGARSRNFILEKKNNKTQVKRVLNFIENFKK